MPATPSLHSVSQPEMLRRFGALWKNARKTEISPQLCTGLWRNSAFAPDFLLSGPAVKPWGKCRRKIFPPSGAPAGKAVCRNPVLPVGSTAADAASHGLTIGMPILWKASRAAPVSCANPVIFLIFSTAAVKFSTFCGETCLQNPCSIPVFPRKNGNFIHRLWKKQLRLWRNFEPNFGHCIRNPPVLILYFLCILLVFTETRTFSSFHRSCANSIPCG